MNGEDNTDDDVINVIKHSPYLSESDFYKIHCSKGSFSVMSLIAKVSMLKLMNFKYLSIASTSLTPLEQYACKKLGLLSLMIISLYEIAYYNVFHLGKLCCNHGSLFINVHNTYKQNLHNLTLVVRIGKRTV